MTRLDIDPRFAAAHYQDGRDLHGAQNRGDSTSGDLLPQQPSVHSVAGDLHPSSTVRTGDEVTPIKFLGQLFVAKHQCGRAVYLSWDEPREVHKVAREMGLTVEVLSQRAGDPFPEMVCAECRDGVCKQSAAAPAPQLGGVSVPPEVAGQRPSQDHPESCGSTQPAAVPAYQPMTDEDVLKQSGAAIRALLSLIRRDAPALSGKVIGNAEAALSAIESAVLARVAAAPAAAPVAQDEREPTWVLLSRPGMSAVRKGPFHDRKLTEQMLRDLYELHPDATCLVIDAPHTTYPTDGREWVSMYGDQRRKPIPRAAAPAAVQPVAQQQPSVHQVVGSGLPSQAVRTGREESELARIHAVVMHVGGDWPDDENDPYTLRHVKWMARELTKRSKA